MFQKIATINNYFQSAGQSWKKDTKWKRGLWQPHSHNHPTSPRTLWQFLPLSSTDLAHVSAAADAAAAAAATASAAATAAQGDNLTSVFEVNYHVSPPIPDWVFLTACSFLVLIGSFGITANLAVIVLFAISPRVGWRWLSINQMINWAQSLRYFEGGLGPIWTQFIHNFLVWLHFSWQKNEFQFPGEQLKASFQEILTRKIFPTIFPPSNGKNLTQQEFVSIQRIERLRLISDWFSLVNIWFVSTKSQSNIQ